MSEDTNVEKVEKPVSAPLDPDAMFTALEDKIISSGAKMDMERIIILQTLAANMASSINRWASVRVRGTIFSMRQLSSQTICVSVVSKSTAPRACRAASNAR